MDGLGNKLEKARIARGLSLEEAGRLTKIRPSKLAEIEAEDFSQFASLAYAKGFLIIYGKFLDVEVSRYLEAFETSEHVTVDGYSYLQDNPAPKPSRPVVVRKESSGGRGSLLPFVIGVVVLVAGFSLLKMLMNVKRVQTAGDGSAIMASVTPGRSAASSENIVAPRALPVDNTPPPTTTAPPRIASSVVPTPVPMPTATPALAAIPTPKLTPSASEPEVRRAEPVHAEDLANVATSGSPSGTTAKGAANKVEIRPLKKTYVKVVIDGNEENPAAERWLTATDTPLKFSGNRISVHVLDQKAVEIRKNGKKLAGGDADVTVE